MHKFAKQIADCLKAKVEGMGIDNINGADLEELKAWSEIIKNIVCYDKDYKIIEEMEKAKEEDEKDEKNFLKMLKEEYGMEEEDARRFYRGQPRSRTSGRFMSRGDGRRRGYEEPPYLHMPYDYRYDMDDYDYADAERMRDMDRKGMNRLYFSEPMGGRDTTVSRAGERMDGYGNMGRNVPSHDSRDGRSWQSRRGYMETKESHSDNTPESKQAKMRELEKYMRELSEDITEMIEGASNEEKTMLRAKVQTLAQKIQ